MRTNHDLSQLDWKLSGWTPYVWRTQQTVELGETPAAEFLAMPAKVPGSVQYSLREAGLIPDWNVGLGWLDCEWVENRDWLYEVVLPNKWFEKGKTYILRCMGLDYKGSIILNGKIIGAFHDSQQPYSFDLTPHLSEEKNVLRIAFDLPPRWLGQFGFTNEMKEWKERFSYTWDWTVRLVQLGIWDSIFIEATDGQKIEDLVCYTDADIASDTGSLKISGRATAGENATVDIKLSRNGSTIREQSMSARQFTAVGMAWQDLRVDLWWTNMEGDQPLYTVDVVLKAVDGSVIDTVTRRVGFKSLAWAQNEGAPEGADPWICVINGRSIFLQGINWVPIRPNFADVTEDDYRKRLQLYKDLGLNILRVWGGAVLEKEVFYNICDELGIMVWQEFPLSSSGGCSTPPDDPLAVEEMGHIAETFVRRRRHHVSLAVWSGGNELTAPDNEHPANPSQPMIRRLQQVVVENDPTRRFLYTSATGPTTYAHPENYGKGLHWDVHGPWKPGPDLKDWEKYWADDDALFRSETGSPGTESMELLKWHAGDLDLMPVDAKNPLWRLPMPWWLETDAFQLEKGRAPESAEEYVEWSQDRQAKALTIAVSACKNRFPRCGGIILWMGHDCWPCPANTAVVDYNGDPKPAALAVGEIFRTPVKR